MEDDSLCWHSIELFYDQKFVASRVGQCMQLQSFSNAHTGHVVLQSVQRFSEAACRLQPNNTFTPIRS